MIGRRYDFTDGLPEPGDYGRGGADGHWYCCVPNTDTLMGNLSKHTVVEHEDGTITVSPSILISSPHRGVEWHGYIEKGVWREV